jgi:aminoglycoside/choline kinase family phosphotransferase
MTSETEQDIRLQDMLAWTNLQLGCPTDVHPASSDASFRRYFRLSYPGRSVIAMDAPPPNEDCRPFVAIASLLADGGVNVPEVLAVDLERGYLLLEDLGRQVWLDVIDAGNADEFFGAAIDTLVTLQQISPPLDFPQYDEDLLRREMKLFSDWYLHRHLCVEPNEEVATALLAVEDLLVAYAVQQPQILVHRDYMPRNLMLTEPNPGVIDFQDAVLGPVSYDAISLFRDAFISWPDDRVREWLHWYWQRAISAGVPMTENFEEFLRWADLMGAQRHIKVIGIFSRICHRDGKPHYVKDVPRFLAYLQAVAHRYDDLAPLRRVLEWLDGLETGSGS